MSNKVDGSIVIETKIDERGIDKGIENIEKKLKAIDDKRVIGSDLPEAEEQAYQDLQKQLNELYRQKQDLQILNSKIKDSENTVTDTLKNEANAVEKLNEAVQDTEPFKFLSDEEMANLDREFQELSTKMEEYQQKINEIKDADREVVLVLHEMGGDTNVYRPLNDEEMAKIHQIEEEYKQYGDRLNEILTIQGEQRREAERLAKEEEKRLAAIKEQGNYTDEMRQNIEMMVADYQAVQNQKIVDSNDVAYAEQLKQEIIEAVNEYEKMTGTRINIKGITDASEGLKEVKKTSNDVGNSFQKLGKKALRVGLAVFGIRSAYLAVRQAMSYITANNEQLGKQLNGMKNSFYSAFTPIIVKIINLIRTLMAYVNYIWNRLFGHDLFKNVVESTEQASKNLGSGAKSAKEIKNQLAGFDEANVLSDNSSSGSGGGIGGGADSGITNLGLDKIKIPDWLVRIMDWVDAHPKLAKILFGLTAFTLLGGGKIAKGLLSGITALLGAGAGVGATGLIGLLGTLALLAGTVYIIYLDYQAITEAIDEWNELNDSIEENNIISDDNIKTNKKLTNSQYDTLKSGEATEEQRKRAIVDINNLTKSTYDQITAGSKNIVNQKKWTTELFNSAVGMDELYRSGKLTEEEQYEYYKMLQNQLNPTLDKSTAYAFGFTKENKNLRGSFDELNKKFETQYTIEVQQNGISKVQSAFENLKSMLSKLFGSNALSNFFGKLGGDLGSAFDNVKNKFSSIFHAEGGIVNLPGRGVPIHYAGEAGREGIVPIDNEGQMALLGSEIAKRVTINLTSVTELNGRAISRELKRLNDESDFAYNR